MKYIIALFTTVGLSLLLAFDSSKPRHEFEDVSYKSKSGIIVNAEKGSFRVSENRNNPEADSIEIHYVKLKSKTTNPLSPIFYLEGGPGSSCTWQAENEYYLEGWLPYLEQRDVVLIDQRGTGKGQKRGLYIWNSGVPDDVFTSKENIQSHLNKVNKKALKTYHSRGIDLNGYTTVENAKDIDELRELLGYESIIPFGFSYGTHLGLSYIRQFDKNVQAAILVGVEGPDHTYKLPSDMNRQLEKIAQLSDADTLVNSQVPSFLKLYERVIGKLDKSPVTVTVKSPLLKLSKEMQVGSVGLNMLLRFDIGDASDIPVFTRFLYSIDQGDYSMLTWFLQKRINMLYGQSAMSITMDKASGCTQKRKNRILKEEKEGYFDSFITNFGMMKTKWAGVDLGDEYRSDVKSDKKVLFLSGSLDFNTPAYQAEEVKNGFPNGSHIVVENAGHEQILRHKKATSTIIRFLNGEKVDSVTMTYPNLKFIPVVGDTKGLRHPSIKI